MNKNRKKLYLILPFVIIFLAFYLIPSFKKEKSLIAPISADVNKSSVTVLAGEKNVSLSFSPDTFFYDALVQARNTGQIEFAGKNYPGLGFFVTDIGTLHAGDGKDLVYYINGKEATVGVSSYTLVPGDIIEWKLE